MDVRNRLEHALGAAYSLDRELAGGGMSHVYVAEERAFGRQVVVKVLRDDLTEGASAERFKREIAVVAKLQHPHIVPLLAAGNDGGTLYYTMPFVEGESLRDRLRREGELPVQDVVRVMREIAAALSYAHRRGIVHRDIKPENILFSDGNAVVTDFGIAKALEAARTQGDERGSTISQMGVALGTPAYMAPEQGAADPTVDHRADLYALGCVGYEMLAGRPPFEGRPTRQLVAAHATEAPAPVGVLRANAPPGLSALVMRCLEKRPADRPQSASEVLRALDGLAGTSSGAMSAAEAVGVGRDAGSRASKLLLACALVGAGIVVGGLAVRWWRGMSPQLGTFDVGLSDEGPILFRTGGYVSLAIAPRGDFVVYVAQTPNGKSQLRYRGLLDTVERPIPGTDGGSRPRISPDGKSVAFIRPTANGAQLQIASMSGGLPRPLADVQNPSAILWVTSSRFVVLTGDGRTFRWFDTQSGPTDRGVPINQCLAPSSPDGGHSLICGGGMRKYGFVLEGSMRHERLLRGRSGASGAPTRPVVGSSFRVVDGKYLVFISTDGELRAARFDRATLEVGRPVTLVTGIRRETYENVGHYDISANGTLVYALGENAEVSRVMIVRPRSNAPQAIPWIDEATAFQRFDPSPDERRLAAVVQARDGQELRIYDVGEGRSQTWLRAPYIGHALWSPRGDRLAVHLGEESTSVLVVGSPDVARAPDTLVHGSSTSPSPDPMSWRLDSVLIARAGGTVLGLDPRSRTPRVDTLVSDADFPDLSPDGRLLLFGRPGTGGILITPFPARNTLSQTNEGMEAYWVSMTTIRYNFNTWSEVSVDSATGRIRGAPRVYHTDTLYADVPGRSSRPMSNGGMTYLQAPVRATGTYLRVVPNWVEKMKRAVDSAEVSRD